MDRVLVDMHICHLPLFNLNKDWHLWTDKKISLPSFGPPPLFSFPPLSSNARPVLTCHLNIHSVMDIPEIILLIGDSLPRRSLATCIRICKLWHKLLAPLLYRTINCLYLPSPSMEGMARHVEHIRNLTLQLHKEAHLMEDGISIFLSLPSLQCRSLHTLTILDVGHDNRYGKSSCEALILLNQQLHNLDVCNGDSDDLRRQLSWRVVFSQCSPFLQTLTLSGSHLSKKETAQLMELGRRLKSLDISDCHCVWSEFTIEPQFPMMTSLKISGLFKGPAQELCWFIQCPQL